jgi:hypothetical protein
VSEISRVLQPTSQKVDSFHVLEISGGRNFTADFDWLDRASWRLLNLHPPDRESSSG